MSKFIELKEEGKGAQYVNVDNILYVSNNMDYAEIFMIGAPKPLQTLVKYTDVMKLIINAPDF